MIRLVEARPNEIDARLVMEWRNDPVTLANSYDGRPKVWETFWPHYLRDYFTLPGLPALFAVKDGERIAQLRFRLYEEIDLPGMSLDIGINLAPERRGQGLATPIIAAACNHAFAWGADRIVAETKPDNAPSRRAFERAGFVYRDEIERNPWRELPPVAVVRYVLERPPDAP